MIDSSCSHLNLHLHVATPDVLTSGPGVHTVVSCLVASLRVNAWNS